MKQLITEELNELTKIILFLEDKKKFMIEDKHALQAKIDQALDEYNQGSGDVALLTHLTKICTEGIKLTDFYIEEANKGLAEAYQVLERLKSFS